MIITSEDAKTAALALAMSVIVVFCLWIGQR
jgi:hypothetical protein